MSLRKYISSTIQSLVRNPITRGMTSLVIGLLTFTLVLLNRSPNLLRPISLILRTGFTLVIPLATIAIYLAFRLRGWLGEVASLTLTLALFAFPLAGLWASGQSQSTVLSGLIPLTDAANYYTDALKLISGLNISAFSARRPFFPGLLSVLLTLSGRNLMVVLGILTAIAGISCYLLAREIQRTHGAAIAVFLLVIVFLYFRAHSGTTMSESLGLPLGALGIAFLWRAASTQKDWLALGGLAVFSLALCVRPGAMFGLPALLFWGAWFFRGNNRISYKFMLGGSGVVLAVFFLNNLTIQLLAGPHSAAFSNFSWALYGLASGGKSWIYIFQVHPEVRQFTEPEQSRQIYKLAFDLIRHNPLLFIKGAFHNWGMFFSNTWYNVFSFTAGENWVVTRITRWLLYLLSLAGFMKWLADRKDSYSGLVGMAALGVLASVPFVPPTDAYRVRLYAATIPIFGLLPALGLTFFLERLNSRSLPNPAPYSQRWDLTTLFSLVLVVIVLTGPVLIKKMGQPPATIRNSCPSEMDSVSIKFDLGTSVNVIRENVPFLDWMPDFHQGLFHRSVHGLADSNLINVMEKINPQSTLFYTLDYQSNHGVLVIMPTERLPKHGQSINLCGYWDTDPNVARNQVFYAASEGTR